MSVFNVYTPDSVKKKNRKYQPGRKDETIFLYLFYRLAPSLSIYIHLDTEKIQKTYSAPASSSTRPPKSFFLQLFDFLAFFFLWLVGSLSINRVICFRKEPESTDIRTHLDGKLKGVHIGQQPQPIRNSCIATHVYMSRRRPLGENVAHTQKKMGNLWPYIQRASEPRFSLTMDWWWMAIGPSLTISARERETKFSTPVIHTHKRRQSIFFPFIFWKSTSIA